MQAWTSLKRLARELAEEDKKYEHMPKDDKLIHKRLLDALLKDYAVVVDIQRIKIDTVSSMLVELQEKEASLSKKKSSSSAYYSGDKIRKSKHRHHNSSFSSSSPSPPRSPKSSRSYGKPCCHLCGGEHYVKNCPDLDEAVKHIAKSKSRSNSKPRSRSHHRQSRGAERPSSTRRTLSKSRRELRGRKGKTTVRKKSNSPRHIRQDPTPMMPSARSSLIQKRGKKRRHTQRNIPETTKMTSRR